MYRRTAEEARDRLGAADDATHRQLSQALARSRAQALEGNQDGAAWTMRRCFDELLRVRGDPQLDDGMPSAKELRAEAAFPGGRARGSSSSSCVVS